MGLFHKKKAPQPSEVELQNAAPVAKSEEIFIKSTDEMNKTDGVITIATIDNETITPTNNPLPFPIDVADRHQKYLQSQKQKEKTKQKKVRQSKKSSTITSIIAIVVIAIIGGTYYYFKKQSTIDILPLKTLTIELGSEVPTTVSSYVDKESIDEMAYNVDYSAINPNVVGEYTFKVTYQNVTKEGKAIVTDTTSPEVEVKDVIIELGQEFSPNDFITSCNDFSNCYYQFESDNTLVNNQIVGEYDIFILITDEYNNPTRKKAKLTVIDQLTTLSCATEYQEKDYQFIEHFEVSFSADSYIKHRRYNEFIFSDKEIYNSYKERFLNQGNYIFNDEANIFTSDIMYTPVQGYTINDYQEDFTSRGYTCSIN